MDKQAGSHNSLYSELNVLNLEILSDHHDLITDVLIDLRDIQTETKVNASKSDVIGSFKALLDEESIADAKLATLIAPTNNAQYRKGV
ncbi:related to collagenase [Vibrio sp. JCM 19236]|nr:related to collagenase [Vibrio sp. JCM 19236]